MRNKMEKPPRITSLRELQDISGHASKRIGPNETLGEMFSYIHEELDELKGAVATGDRQQVASELPDVMIFLMKIADHYGIDMAEAMTNKVARNAHKYNWSEMSRLIESGKSYKEARQIMKDKWDKSRDEEFYVE